MPRYDERTPRLIDIVPMFESKSSADHAYNAYAAIQRLRDDGAKFWEEGTDQRNRWNRGCNTLIDRLNALPSNRVAREDWTTVFRELLHEFEHATQRMNQMLQSENVENDFPGYADQFHSWIDFTYRLLTYAMISTWIDDKTVHQTVHMEIDLASGATTIDWGEVPRLGVPRCYKSKTEHL